jgi:hypothetical protein
MRPEDITVETIDIEPPGLHADLSPYETVVFRVLPASHPNSFTAPISVNLSQFPAQEAQAHARFVFHRLMRSLSQATQDWDRAEPIAEPSHSRPTRIHPAFAFRRLAWPRGRSRRRQAL